MSSSSDEPSIGSGKKSSRLLVKVGGSKIPEAVPGSLQEGTGTLGFCTLSLGYNSSISSSDLFYFGICFQIDMAIEGVDRIIKTDFIQMVRTRLIILHKWL
jgi:hypothetical protein